MVVWLVVAGVVVVAAGVGDGMLPQGEAGSGVLLVQFLVLV